ncbi:MAG TPA: cobalt ECF transporter T component CbiQ [Planctomycetota bacterium]|nr:cobalt ECF transporter T component CbiQ [Planctomycetota bacterium]
MHHSHIDRYAHGDSSIHRLDPRAKFLAVIAYTGILISFDRYAVSALAPMAVLPLVLLWFGGIPTWFVVRRVLVLSPFILVLCLVSPYYDRVPHAVSFGPWRYEMTGGWLTAADIALKFALGIMTLTALMSTTPFAQLLEGMRKLGVPRMFVVQLGFLYRYLFLLIDEGLRLKRGRDFRGAARVPVGRRLRAVGAVIGHLFIHTLDRSDRIHTAMTARGYRGEWHGLSTLRFRRRDAVFLLVTAAYLVICRWGYLLLH